LLIAAIFAAAMSSLSSNMNSAATAYATDIHFRFGWGKDVNQLTLARIATLVIGIIGIMFAFLMATWDIKSLWDEFQKVLGLVIGGLGGVFILGILSKSELNKRIDRTRDKHYGPVLCWFISGCTSAIVCRHRIYFVFHHRLRCKLIF
jgi:solute:Na+ symporter, SSS family